MSNTDTRVQADPQSRAVHISRGKDGPSELIGVIDPIYLAQGGFGADQAAGFPVLQEAADELLKKLGVRRIGEWGPAGQGISAEVIETAPVTTVS